jgi:Flp pilus assembly protein TadD
LLLAAAAAVRFAAVVPDPPASPAESATLAAADPEARAEASDAAVGVLAALRRVAPDPSFAAGVIEGFVDPVDPVIRSGRAISAFCGVLAAVLTALSARRWGVLPAAVAGGLVAIAPGAVAGSTSAGAGGLLLLASSGTLLILSSGFTASPARGALGGIAIGLATASGGGGAGLLLGLPWAVRVGAARRATAIALLPAGMLLGLAAAPGALGRLPAFPSGPAGPPSDAASPLLAALLRLGEGAGVVGTLFALGGALRVAHRGEAGERAILAATAGSLLLAVLRSGPDPTALCVALPGVGLLAARAIAGAPSGRAFAGAAALLAAALGTAGLLASRWAPTPQERAAAWIRGNVPANAPLLVEDPDVLVPTPAGLEALRALAAIGRVAAERVEEYAPSGKTLFPVPLGGGAARERALWYDPNLAQFFPWMVLRERIPDDGAEAELEAARRVFHEYFREAWTEAARFPSGLSRAAAVVVLSRPEGFELDRKRLAPLAPVLASRELQAVRDTSTAFTQWLREAGASLRAGGELAGARGFLDLAVTRDSTDAETWVQLALVHLARGRDEDAKADLVKGLELDPFHGGIHYHLGVVLESEGDPAGAETEYRAAITYLSDPRAAHARLGALLFARGDAAGARAELATLKSVDPFGDATRVLEELLGSP